MPNDPQPLDDVDRALLTALSENARLPNAKLAERAGIALVGFLRGGSFNVYGWRERVIEARA